MNPQEKMAWYTLTVVLMTVVAYSVLLSLTGNPDVSLVAFALLALIAFAPMFATGKKGKVVADEHDLLINLKAGRAACVVFWLYFVGYCLLSLKPWDYSETIPSYLVSTLLWTGACVLLGAKALATLVLYRADATEKRTIVDRYRKMSGIRRTGLWTMVICMPVMLPFMIVMIEVGKGNVPQLFGYLICGSFAVVYFLIRHYLGIGVSSDEEVAELARVRKRGDRSLATSISGAAAGLGLVWVLPMVIAMLPKGSILPRIPLVIFYGLMGAWLGLGVSAFFSGTNFIVEVKLKPGAKER